MRDLRGADKGGVIRLAAVLCFLEFHIALQIHLRPATGGEHLRHTGFRSGRLRRLSFQNTLRLNISERLQLPGFALRPKIHEEFVGL
jgi:hypothetical protein